MTIRLKLENGYLDLNEDSCDFIDKLMVNGEFWEYVSNLINVDVKNTKYNITSPNNELISMLAEIKGALENNPIKSKEVINSTQPKTNDVIQPKVKKSPPKGDMGDVGRLAKLMGQRTKK